VTSLEAQALYDALNGDFIKEGISDCNWAARMPDLQAYLCDGFKQSGMGLMCDFASAIEKIYTTVFLSDKVLSKILSDNPSNALIFSHHPVNWDLREHNGPYAATESLIRKLRDRNIAVYVLHHPLDHYGDYSTCKTLADQLGMRAQKPGFSFCGALCGVVGFIDCETADQLRERYSKVVGHQASLYPYGQADIRGERIAICPGGGNASSVVDEMIKEHIKVLITGVSIVNDHSRQTHKREQENRISVLGGTHYSTEKFAPMKMCAYFKKHGLPAEFVKDEPDLYDL